MCLLRWDRVEDLLSYGLLILGLLVLPTSLVTGRCIPLSFEVEIEMANVIFFHFSVECTIAEGNDDPGHQILCQVD